MAYLELNYMQNMQEKFKGTPSQNFSPMKNYSYYTLEIENLKARIEDLESAIEINQKILIDIVHSKVSELSPENSDTVSNFSPKVLECMLIEHIKLKKEFNKSLIERNESQCKSLLSQQIATETELKLNEIESEYRENIKEYDYQIEAKNKLIEELKITNKELTEKKNFQLYSKHAEVVPPKEEIMQIHIKIEDLKECIQFSARNCLIASNYKDHLLTSSTNLYNTCKKIQALLKNPINRKSVNDRLEITPLEEFSDKSDTDSSSESSEIEISERNRSHTVSNKLSVVPVMDFTKIHTKGHEKSLATLHASASMDFQKTGEAKEMKNLYLNLNEKINDCTQILQRVSEKNKKIQTQNIELVTDNKKITASINAKMNILKNAKVLLEEIPEQLD